MEVSSAREKGVEDKAVLYSMLPPARRSALDEYLGKTAFDFVSFSKVWDVRQAELTALIVTARIGVPEPRSRRFWEFGLVDISAERSA